MDNIDEEIKKKVANALDARISILRGIASRKTTVKRSGGFFDSFDYIIGDISGWARGYAEGLVVGKYSRPITKAENEEIRSLVRPYEEKIQEICSAFPLE